MSRKLKIYSLTLIGVVVFFVINSLVSVRWAQYKESDDERLEMVTPPAEFDTESDGHDTNEARKLSYQVRVRHNNLRVCDVPERKILLSTAKGQRYEIEMEQVRLWVPASKGIFSSSHHKAIYIVHNVTYGIIIAWILFLAFSVLYKIHLGKVFVSHVSRALLTAGILLTFLYVLLFAESYVLARYMMENIKLADYHIVFTNEVNSMYLIMGLTLMILSQVILMGKDLKDEQELTI